VGKIKTKKMSNKKVEFVIEKLKEYAKTTGNLPRGTTDISPLEEWLLMRWFESLGKINYETLVTIGEACVFMQGYKGTCTKEGEWSDWDEQLLVKLQKIVIEGNGA
jgi:hypothetical protein